MSLPSLRPVGLIDGSERDTRDRDDELMQFLVARLVEELESVRARDDRGFLEPRARRSLDIAIIDELLVPLAEGRMPTRRELRVLLESYRDHPEFDPHWNRARG